MLKQLGCSPLMGDGQAKPDPLPSAHNPQVQHDNFTIIKSSHIKRVDLWSTLKTFTLAEYKNCSIFFYKKL